MLFIQKDKVFLVESVGMGIFLTFSACNPSIVVSLDRVLSESLFKQSREENDEERSGDKSSAVARKIFADHGVHAQRRKFCSP